MVKLSEEFPEERVKQINKAIEYFQVYRKVMGYSKEKARKFALKSARIIK